MKHWAEVYIGIPYKLGGRTILEGLDCWGLFRLVQRNHYRREIPECELAKEGYNTIIAEVRGHPEMRRWRNIGVGLDGCAVMLHYGADPVHLGTFIDSEGVKGILHTVKSVGVIFQGSAQLRNSGWKVQGFYGYV